MNDELKEIVEKEKQRGSAVFGQDIKRGVKLEHAGPVQRYLAFLTDSVIVFAIFLMFAHSGYEIESTRNFMGEQLPHSDYVFDISVWYANLLFILMKVLFEFSPLQASPGKLLFYLKVTDENGERLGLLQLFIREIGFFFIPFTWITYFFGEEKQCIHDKIVKSYVVKRSSLSDLLFIPAVVISLALLSLDVYWMSQKMTGRVETQTVVQEQFVPQVNKEEAIKEAIIPEDDKIGSIKIDGESIELNTVYVRLKNSIKYTSFGELKKSGQELEIALYEEIINPEKLKKLIGISDLMSGSETVVKNNPIAIISMKSDDFDFNCKNLIIKDSDLIINPNMLGNVNTKGSIMKLRVDEMKLNSQIFMNCETIKGGEELFFSMQSPFKLENNREGLINIRFTEKVRELKYAGGYVYRHSNPKLVLAVYNKEQQQMKIAFYRSQFSKESLNTAYVKGILPTTPAPSFILDIPVNSQLYGSGRDIVSKGYTITFKDLPEEIGKGLAHRDYQIKFDAGETPARFVVQSQHAPQVQGRLEGVKEIVSSEGVSNLAWNVSFNSRLILIKR